MFSGKSALRCIIHYWKIVNKSHHVCIGCFMCRCIVWFDEKQKIYRVNYKEKCPVVVRGARHLLDEKVGKIHPVHKKTYPQFPRQ